MTNNNTTPAIITYGHEINTPHFTVTSLPWGSAGRDFFRVFEVRQNEANSYVGNIEERKDGRFEVALVTPTNTGSELNDRYSRIESKRVPRTFFATVAEAAAFLGNEWGQNPNT